jgi:hypothetical protein
MPDEMNDVEKVTLQLVAERIKGLSSLTDQGFKDIQRQLDDVRGLPAVVSRMTSEYTALEKRVSFIEGDRGKGAEFRRGSLPIILLTCVLALSSLVAVIQSLIGH